MALTFGGATSDRVDHGNIASAPTQFTIFVWANPSTLTTTRRFTGKGGSTGFINFGLHPTTASQVRLVIDYVTTDANADSAAGTVTTGSWQCFAGTFDGSTAPKIYKGTLTSSIAEVTYSGTPAAPSGARVAEATTAFYTGNDSAFTRSFQGDIAFVGVWNRALSAGELIDQQFQPHKTSGCILFTHYGFNSTGSQPDWSGNVKNGTVTGATLAAAHAPILGLYGSRNALPYVVSVTGITGSGGITIQKPALAAAGLEAFTGTGTLTIRKPALAASGLETFSGTAALTFRKPTLAASGALTFSGTATITIQKPVLTANGTTGNVIAGTVALTIRKPSLAVAALEAFTGTSSVTIRKPTLAGSGLLAYTGTATLTIRAPGLSASGTVLVTITGTGAIIISRPIINASQGISIARMVLVPGRGTTGLEVESRSTSGLLVSGRDATGLEVPP